MVRVLFNASLVLLVATHSAPAQDTCDIAQNHFFNEGCATLSQIHWRSPRKGEVEIGLLTSERDRISCDHLRELRSQSNSLLSFVNQAPERSVPTSVEEYIAEAEYRIASIERFQGYHLGRFFARSQFLEVSIEYQAPENDQYSRLAVIFNGEISEYPVSALVDDDSSSRITFNLLTNSAEMCFKNNMLVVIYEDTLEKDSFLLYRQPMTSLALSMSFEDLEALQLRPALYRNRRTDNDG